MIFVRQREAMKELKTLAVHHENATFRRELKMPQIEVVKDERTTSLKNKNAQQT